jgi:hypothetical protein
MLFRHNHPLNQTRRFCQEHTSGTLPLEDEHEILQNVAAFFRILKKWLEADRRIATPQNHSEHISASPDEAGAKQQQREIAATGAETESGPGGPL